MGWKFWKAADAAATDPARLIDDDGRVLTDADGRPIEVASGLDSAAAAELQQLRKFKADAEAAEAARLEAEAAARLQAREDAAAAFAAKVIAANKALPAAESHLKTLYLAAHADGADPEIAAKALDGLVEALPGHKLTEGLVQSSAPAGSRTLEHGGGGDKPITPERKAELLAHTPTGRAALAQANGAAR